MRYAITSLSPVSDSTCRVETAEEALQHIAALKAKRVPFQVKDTLSGRLVTAQDLQAGVRDV